MIARFRIDSRNAPTLSFERLEDRTLLSIFTVTNLGDAGSGSLRQAVIDANNSSGDDTIVFQSGLNGMIQLTSGEMDVTDNLVVTGLGQTNTVIDAQQNSRIFDVSGSNTVFTLNSLTLQNGRVNTYSEDGGAIRSTSAGGTLTISGSTLSSNSIVGSSSLGGAQGGAIYSLSDAVNIINSSLMGNYIGEGIYGGNGKGGAIYAKNGAVTIAGSTVSGATVPGSSASFGGAVVARYGNVSISNSTLSGNSSVDSGGAILAYDGDVT
ncbi:MAG: hypothetical protein KDA75_15060, partial [Planctomycetaceae bacterium]|nr:hypothetical protein [Planctomycetaceae bacterium]